jgi:hypothetical protein
LALSVRLDIDLLEVLGGCVLRGAAGFSSNFFVASPSENEKGTHCMALLFKGCGFSPKAWFVDLIPFQGN